jgi:hypothetical protein
LLFLQFIIDASARLADLTLLTQQLHLILYIQYVHRTVVCFTQCTATCGNIAENVNKAFIDAPASSTKDWPACNTKKNTVANMAGVRHCQFLAESHLG